MKTEDRYHRFVQWSDEDQCYIGYCPDIFYGGCCHGDMEEEVYAELCGIVREEIAYRLTQKQELPQPFVRATRDLDFPEVSSTAAPISLPKSPFDPHPSISSNDRMNPPAPGFVDFFAGRAWKRDWKLGDWILGSAFQELLQARGMGNERAAEHAWTPTLEFPIPFLRSPDLTVFANPCIRFS